MGDERSNHDEAAEDAPVPETTAIEEKTYPPSKKVIPAMIAIYLVFFLIALDRTIIGTAIPRISSDFNSFGDIAWYESAFLLPLCVLQLSFGLVFKYYSTKWTIFALTAVFEIGSIVCAAAPNSKAFIVGRAITGIGGAGIGPGSYLLITLLVPLQARPKYLGSLGSVFGISSFLGPILGGYLTSITWRWCFWINVPIGGVALLLLLLLAPNVPPPAKPASTWRQKFLDLDPIGFLLIAGSVICLLFALEFGGQDQDWSEARIIALFVVFGVLLVAFIGFQAYRGEKATVPPHVISKRLVLVSCLLCFCIASVLVILAFYLPIWFQAVQGKSPQSSGLSLLPLLLSNVLCVIASGVLVGIIGYFTPFAIAGSAILVTGTALISTWTADTGKGRWIGYQILAGAGLGLCLQQPAIAVQTILSDSDIAVGLSLLNFANFLGGSIFITVSQLLLEDQLNRRFARILPGLDATTLSSSSVTSIRKLVSSDEVGTALAAYNDSMRSIWYLCLGLSCLALVTSFGLGWTSVKPAKAAGAAADAMSVCSEEASKVPVEHKV